MTSTRPWITWLAGLALALRMGIALRPLDFVDRWFVPDDTFYTLGFARALAHNHGPTLDGVTLSNGFQPLLTFLLVPVFWLTHDNDAALRAALLIGALADAATVLFLGKLAQSLAGRQAGILSAALWALSPVAIANALCGLETSLALALQLATMQSYVRLRDPPTQPARQAVRWAVFGACAGFAILARISTVSLIAALVVAELLHVLRQRKPEPARGPLLAVGSACLVLLPWWSYCLLRFGTPIPESGGAVIQITRLHRALYLTTQKQLAWAAGSVLGAPFSDLPWLREALFDHSSLGVLGFAGVACVLFGVAFRLLLLEREAPHSQRAVGAFALHALCVLSLYAFFVPALWFFRRYLVSSQALFTLLFGIALARAWARLKSASPQGGLRGAALGAWLTAGLFTALGLARIWQFATESPGSSPDFGLHGAKGYREAARGVLARVPSGAVLGAFQSGALSYYAPAGVRVVNLDGVVDHEARSAAQELRLSDYAASRALTHLTDWQFNLDAFERLSSQAYTRPTMRPIETQVERQGPDRFSLLALSWPRAASRPTLEPAARGRDNAH